MNHFKNYLGLICLSKNFLNSSWAKSEMNYFFQQRINQNKNNFICINIDLSHEEIPPLLQDYYYLDLRNTDWKTILTDTIRKKSCV